MENSASTNHAALVAIAAEDIQAQQGKPTTTSLLVAQRFKKQHKNVLAAIRNIVKEVPEYGLDYKPIQIDTDLGMNRTRKDPAYLMTEQGFSVLVMGFTGSDAMRWKFAYAKAFTQMRKALERYVSFGVPAGMYARALEAEKNESGSFAKASVAGRTLSLRRKEKKAFQSIVAMVRAEVQLQLLIGNTSN